jgi:hypothetical protein
MSLILVKSASFCEVLKTSPTPLFSKLLTKNILAIIELIKMEKLIESLRRQERLKLMTLLLILTQQKQWINLLKDKLNMKQELTIPNNLNQLAVSLKTIAPTNSETTQLITYTLIATALVGIFVYQYIKAQEQNN